jgi:hypothetical protein
MWAIVSVLSKVLGHAQNLRLGSNFKMQWVVLLAFAYQGKDIAFRFIIEYASLRDFGP